MRCNDWKHIDYLAQIFFFLPILFEIKFFNWYFWGVWMDMGVWGESNLWDAYCVLVDCRVSRFAPSSQWQGVCYSWTVLLITPSFVIARAEKPVAIHCERGNEGKSHDMSNQNASIACSGLPRRSLWFPPRNDKGVCYPRTVLLITPSFVIARAEKPVAIHCEP